MEHRRPPEARSEYIGPTEALALLARNVNYRNAKHERIKLYASDIAATIMAGLALPQRVLWTELAVFATNPWKED